MPRGLTLYFLRIPFSIDTHASAEGRSEVMEFLKESCKHFKHQKLVSTEALCKQESDGLASSHAFCTEYKDRTNQLSYWLNSRFHGNQEQFVYIPYLKTAARHLLITSYHKFLIRSVVRSTFCWQRYQKLLLFYEPGHFHITHEIRNKC